MKELQRMAVYGLLTVAVMAFLFKLVTDTGKSGSVVGVAAILAVIVIPVIIGVWMGKREQREKSRSTR